MVGSVLDVIGEMWHYVILVFMGLLPIANPFSTAVVFVPLAANMTPAERNALARSACLYMALILMVFLGIGAIILTFFGITISALRLAGGLVVGYIGFRMLFPSEQDGKAAELPGSGVEGSSVAFMPLAMPLLSGPGSIAIVISSSADLANTPDMLERVLGYIVVAVGIILTSFVCWLVLRSASKVTRFLGATGIDVLTRLMGFILIAIAVQFADAGLGGFLSK